MTDLEMLESDNTAILNDSEMASEQPTSQQQQVSTSEEVEMQSVMTADDVDVFDTPIATSASEQAISLPASTSMADLLDTQPVSESSSVPFPVAEPVASTSAVPYSLPSETPAPLVESHSEIATAAATADKPEVPLLESAAEAVPEPEVELDDDDESLAVQATEDRSQVDSKDDTSGSNETATQDFDQFDELGTATIAEEEDLIYTSMEDVDEESTRPLAQKELLSHIEFPPSLQSYVTETQDNDQSSHYASRAPPVLLRFGDEAFWLFGIYKEDSSLEAPTVLFEDIAEHHLYYNTLEMLFTRLHDHFPSFEESQMEMVLSVPKLEMTIAEDNVYSRQVSLHDFGRIHIGCDQPAPLQLELAESARFIFRFNALANHVAKFTADDMQNLSEHGSADSSVEIADELATEEGHPDELDLNDDIQPTEDDTLEDTDIAHPEAVAVVEDEEHDELTEETPIPEATQTSNRETEQVDELLSSEPPTPIANVQADGTVSVESQTSVPVARQSAHSSAAVTDVHPSSDHKQQIGLKQSIISPKRNREEDVHVFSDVLEGSIIPEAKRARV